jgi:predicted PurR-regulated permease PerM
MGDLYEELRVRLSHDLMQVALRALLLILMLWICLKLFLPFAPLLVWSLILAVTLYPVQQKLARQLGNRPRLSASIIAILGLLLLGVPSIMLGVPLIEQLISSLIDWRNEGRSIPAPDASVKDWPLIGSALYEAWLAISDNLQGYLRSHADEVRAALSRVVSGTGGVITTVLTFAGALVIAVVIMVYGEQSSHGARRIAVTLVGGERGANLQRLAVATIRSVAAGVIGVAVVQALLLGFGFLWAEIPGAGIWALVALILGIIQLPAILIVLPVLGWLWGFHEGDVVRTTMMTVYFVVAGLSDNIMKPLLLGRGVEVPMPVVLLGALGGMIWMGLIGLFLGSVILSVGYQLFWAWVAQESGLSDPFGDITNADSSSDELPQTQAQ